MLTLVTNYRITILKEREHMNDPLSAPYNKTKGDKYYFPNEVIT